ncbi:MAG TPA: hypothetical protein P5076_00730, partial [Myxococcota bacterium]|nr:hypothetical protein [Myxococcota bacterium]
DAAPQAELIQVLWLMHQKGLSADQAGFAGSARQLATQYKLAEVAAFLERPVQPAMERRAAAAEAPAADLSRDELKAVCAGQPVPGAAPYELRADRAAPIFAFERRFKEYRWTGELLPRWWTPRDEPGRTQLVVCADAVEKKVARECRYEGPGGGLSLYDATYELSLYEARSGKRLATQRLPLQIDSSVCPAVKMGEDQEGRFPGYAAELQTFVKPFVGGPE